MLWSVLWLTLALAALIPPTFSASELRHLQGDPMATHKVTLAIAKNKMYYGGLTVALFGDVVPKTSENFAALANMSQGFGYDTTPFHRIIKDFMVQGGDFENKDGTGGRSIYGKHFPDENFELKHDKYGRVSMANSGKDRNGAQFFITTRDECLWLDGKHVVFGQLVDGFELLEEMNNCTTGVNDRPNDEYLIYKGETALIDYTQQKSLQELLKEEEIEQAALRGETTLFNDQVRVMEVEHEDSMGGYIFLMGFCLIVLVIMTSTKRKRVA